MAIARGRFTVADDDGEVVVFLIGMRFTNPLRVRRWWPVFTAMPSMLRSLSTHPELGCLGYHLWGGRTVLILSYWRDMESLDRFAHDRELPHLEPWRRFNRALRAGSDVGIWHETYRVRPGDYETIYVNMPPFGLGKALGSVPVDARRDTAAARLRRPATTD